MSLRERLSDPRPVLLDGATGTELQRRGAPMDPAAWCGPATLHNDELLTAIHADYIAAGARLLEPACGSANDYRYLAAFGIAGLLDYTGFDLCEKNVANARALFPRTRFEVGNVFEIAAADQAFALCFVHDLLEHLSPAGLERAVEELCRRAVCL